MSWTETSTFVAFCSRLEELSVTNERDRRAALEREIAPLETLGIGSDDHDDGSEDRIGCLRKKFVYPRCNEQIYFLGSNRITFLLSIVFGVEAVVQRDETAMSHDPEGTLRRILGRSKPLCYCGRYCASPKRSLTLIDVERFLTCFASNFLDDRDEMYACNERCESGHAFRNDSSHHCDLLSDDDFDYYRCREFFVNYGRGVLDRHIRGREVGGDARHLPVRNSMDMGRLGLFVHFFRWLSAVEMKWLTFAMMRRTPFKTFPRAIGSRPSSSSPQSSAEQSGVREITLFRHVRSPEHKRVNLFDLEGDCVRDLLNAECFNGREYVPTRVHKRAVRAQLHVQAPDRLVALRRYDSRRISVSRDLTEDLLVALRSAIDGVVLDGDYSVGAAYRFVITDCCMWNGRDLRALPLRARLDVVTKHLRNRVCFDNDEDENDDVIWIGNDCLGCQVVSTNSSRERNGKSRLGVLSMSLPRGRYVSSYRDLVDYTSDVDTDAYAVFLRNDASRYSRDVSCGVSLATHGEDATLRLVALGYWLNIHSRITRLSTGCFDTDRQKWSFFADVAVSTNELSDQFEIRMKADAIDLRASDMNSRRIVCEKNNVHYRDDDSIPTYVKLYRNWIVVVRHLARVVTKDTTRCVRPRVIKVEEHERYEDPAVAAFETRVTTKRALLGDPDTL